VSTARRIRVIVNPSARSGNGQRALRPLRRHPPDGTSIEWIESRSGAHLRELVAAAQLEGPGGTGALDALAVAGGDGTVALAVAGLGDVPRARLPLGILPTGSGNDFAGDLGIPRRARDAFGVLLAGVARRIDVLEDANGGRVVCVASVGFDSLSLPIVHGGLPRTKVLNVYAAVQGMLHYQPRNARITWAGGAYEGPIVFAAATNTRTYAGGFRITPEARVDDGLLDVCVVRAVGAARLLRIFANVMTTEHKRFPEVILTQSPWMRIETLGDGAGRAGAGEMPVAFDGELGPRATPIELRCRPAAVEVLCPPAAVAEVRDAA
jgi:diacylglycerol kinase (ATP)